MVVFDRVRENLRKYKKMPLKDVLNLSMNETLSRTVMTLLDHAAGAARDLLLRRDVTFGLRLRGDLRRRSVGTYSSIYVATAIVLLARGQARLVQARRRAAGTRFAKA